MARPIRLLVAALAVSLCGCATSGVVHIETGWGRTVEYNPPSTPRVVEVGQREFLQAVSRLARSRQVLVELATAFSPKPIPWQSADATARTRTGGLLRTDPGPWGRVTLVGFNSEDEGARREGWRDRAALIGAAQNLTERERLSIALSASIDTLWEGVAEAVSATLNPQELRSMLVGMICGYMLTIILPEPVTKFIAIALTAYLVAYIGYFPFWNILRAFRHMREDCGQAQWLRELTDAGHRFGAALGDNGGRILILAALAVAGGKASLSSRGPTLPGYAGAVAASEVNFGLRLSAVAEGGVTSITLATPGAVVVGAAPAAVASTAWQGGGGGPRPRGKLTGRPTRVHPNQKNPGGTRGLIRENETAQKLVEHGYDVEQNPPSPPGSDKKPDYKISGEYWDCYSPEAPGVRNISSGIEQKIIRDQAKKIVVNLDDTPVSVEELSRQLHDWPLRGLEEVLAVKGDQLLRIYP